MRTLPILAPLTALLLAGADTQTVTLPTSPEDLARGKKLFMGACTYCHGPTGDGGKGADLSRRELTHARTDAELVRIIEVGLPGTEMPGVMHMTDRELQQTAAFVRSLGQSAGADAKLLTGDAARGKELYAKHGCANCHTVAEAGVYRGGLMGPDLSIIGSRRNAAHLRESLLAPEASLPNSFLHTTVVTNDGRRLTGQRANEDTFTLVLRDFGGVNHVLAKESLKSISKEKNRSPMPSYRGKLNASELEDLVAYLASLKETRR